MSQSIALEPRSQLGTARVVTTAFAAILAGHVAVDALAALLPSTLGLFEARLHLTAKQAAWLLGLGPLCSGLAQPVCALISDRLKSRWAGVIGIALGAIGIGSLGFADGMVSLAVVYALGMIGIGMFHPIGVATIVHLRDHRRTAAVSMFFVAGMCGGISGALVWPRLLSTPEGLAFLPWAVIPVLMLAALLHRCFSELAPPRHVDAAQTGANASRDHLAMVLVLYVAAALRFSVNTALAYLFVRLAQGRIFAEHADWSKEQIAVAAAPTIGNLNAAMLIGMASGGLLAGMLVRPGKETRPMVWVPILCAPVIALFPYGSLQVGYVLAAVSGIGFAAMIPVAIALAQQLLPRHTNLASGLMMGGAWALAMLGPRCAEFGVAHLGMHTTFILTAVVLACSGIVSLPVSNQLKPSVPLKLEDECGYL